MLKSDTLENHCQNCLSTTCFIKVHCTDNYLSILNDLVEISIYRKDQYIVREGNSISGLFFLKTGKAKIVSSGLAGKTQMVRLTKQSDIIGHRGYGGEKYPISAIALEESVICFIDNNTIFNAFMNSPKLTYALMIYYSEELRKSESKIKSQAQMNVREKVADALIYCNTLFNSTNSYPFDIILNRQDLSNLAGINTEQLSRILSEFKKDTIISLSKNEILVHNINYLKGLVSPFGIH